MSDHFVDLIYLVLIPPIVFILSFKWRRHLFARDTSFNEIIKFTNYSLLASLSIFFTVPSSVSDSDLDDFVEFYNNAFVALLILGLLWLGYDLYKNSKSEDTKSTLGFTSTILIVVALILASITVGEDTLLGEIDFNLILPFLSIIVIALGIALYPMVSNFLSVRQISGSGLLKEGDQIMILGMDDLEGTIIEINYKRIIIQDDKFEYFIQPRKLLELGYRVKATKAE